MTPRIWKDIQADHDPDGHALFGGYIDHLDAIPGGAEDKTRELIYVAVLTAVRAPVPLGIHTKRALAAGASREEIVQAVSIAGVLAGLPTLSLALATVEEALA